jgi:hypothetical protein
MKGLPHPDVSMRKNLKLNPVLSLYEFDQFNLNYEGGVF